MAAVGRAGDWHRRETPGVVSRGFKVPRCSRSLLARALRAGALAAALALAGGQARGQQASSQQVNDADSGLLAPALDGNPRNPPRFRATQKKTDLSRFGQLPSFRYRRG